LTIKGGGNGGAGWAKKAKEQGFQSGEDNSWDRERVAPIGEKQKKPITGGERSRPTRKVGGDGDSKKEDLTFPSGLTERGVGCVSSRGKNQVHQDRLRVGGRGRYCVRGQRKKFPFKKMLPGRIKSTPEKNLQATKKS